MSPPSLQFPLFCTFCTTYSVYSESVQLVNLTATGSTEWVTIKTRNYHYAGCQPQTWTDIVWSIQNMIISFSVVGVISYILSTLYSLGAVQCQWQWHYDYFSCLRVQTWRKYWIINFYMWNLPPIYCVVYYLCKSLCRGEHTLSLLFSDWLGSVNLNTKVDRGINSALSCV